VPAFTDFAREASHRLDGVSRYFYLQEEVPSATDHEILQICRALEAAGPAMAGEMAAALDDHKRLLLGIFSRRSPQLVLARDIADAERGEVLAAGLVAGALAYAGHRDFREVLVGLAPHYECARRLKLDITDVFDAAALFADEETGALMRIFGRRSDVTLARFGWREIQTPTGPAFEPE
jgi:hypothetical protein